MEKVDFFDTPAPPDRGYFLGASRDEPKTSYFQKTQKTELKEKLKSIKIPAQSLTNRLPKKRAQAIAKMTPKNAWAPKISSKSTQRPCKDRPRQPKVIPGAHRESPRASKTLIFMIVDGFLVDVLIDFGGSTNQVFKLSWILFRRIIGDGIVSRTV